MTTTQPIPVSSCARATTAREMRFRIQRPIAGRRGPRIVALDAGADAIVRGVAAQPWGAARFFTLAAPVPSAVPGGSESIRLRDSDGNAANLLDELADADVVIMIGTVDSDDNAATLIGAACAVRGITTAGLIVGDPGEVGGTVTQLRPHARVLMTTTDEQDVAEVLTALRA